MRVLLGLVALAASVNAQTVTISGSATNAWSTSITPGNTALASFRIWNNVAQTSLATVSQGAGYSDNVILTAGNWGITIPSTQSVLVFVVTTNTYTAQLQYRWSPNYNAVANGQSASTYTCDTCAGGTFTTCAALGPGTNPSPANGFQCALLSRTYTFTGIQQSVNGQAAITNSFSIQLLDRNTAPGPNTSSYSFTIVRSAPAIVGDPQIIGMQGQDFQVHGVPDEIFNMITYPNLQVNARFVYLSSGECIDNYTACFAHPGTYISEEGIRLGNDKIHVRSGAAKKGLTVSVNGKKLITAKTDLKLGSIELVNHRRVVVKTPVMSISITNSDKFLNQETSLRDSKLLALGAERRSLGAGESFHSEVPLHGLQGQTWRNVEYPSGLDYEGSISDYQVMDGNLFGTDFTFNQFSL